VETFESTDGTTLAFHRIGHGDPLICVPGGPMQPSSYLGDLGGLSAHRELIMLDLRGTGDSAVPTDPGSYRADRQTADLDALRAHLELDRFDLLAHCAGTAVALPYAAANPARIRTLTLVTPSPYPAGVEVTDADRRATADRRHGEPWFPTAYAAFERIWSDQATPADWALINPFRYGRWDATVESEVAEAAAARNDEAAGEYYAPGAVDPSSLRAALPALTSPVLLLTGELDVALPPAPATAFAALFPNATLTIQPEAGHLPWLDDSTHFVATVNTFLRG
jgi:pimeloyl-ACP methyl ester carboxylesterase